jgi:hypothetical protein
MCARIGPTGGAEVEVRTTGAARAGQVLQAVLVGVLASLLLALAMVAFPGLLSPDLRESLGLAAAEPSVPSGSDSYTFLAVQPGTRDQPVTYSSCRTLHYVINFDGAPARFADGRFIHDAVARMSVATGLRFTYDGTSTLRRQTRSYSSGPILFSFDDVADDPQLDGAAAIGGSATVVRHGHEVYSTGEVTFERDYFAKLASLTTGEAQARAIALHEIGHVVGLGHVHDPDEIMDAYGGHRLDLGPGDLNGLRIIGAVPCY